MPEPWRVHTIVFDLDDTLIAERDYVLSGFAAVDTWIQLNLMRSGFGTTAVDLFTGGKRGKIFDEAIDLMGLSGDASLVPRLIDIYRNHEPKIRLLPDAKAALEWARNNVDLGLISDGWLTCQERKVRALELNQVIPEIILTDRWGREGWKPALRAFLSIMQTMHGRNADGFVYVGDNPLKDFSAPRRLGWRTIRIRRTGGEHFAREAIGADAADREIPTLFQLPELVSAAH